MTYTHLQNQIDSIIGVLGTPKTVELLNRLSSNLNLTKKSDLQHIELLATFIITESYNIFEVTKHEVKIKAESYGEAKTACYYLLRKYTPLSYRDIASRFKESKRNAIYYCNKCDDRMTIPKQYPKFLKKYALLEERILDFMTQIH